MLDEKGFDLWADSYDEAVGLSDKNDTYPFAGYREVLGTIYRTIMEKGSPSVLDLGFGTGTLTSKLYKNGCEVYGQDFSARMTELALEKMPEAHLYQGDFSDGLVGPLNEKTYDYIVATYSLHHLTDEQKIALLRDLRKRLNDDGMILIGDVAFRTREELERCRQKSEEWDDDEIYCVAEELSREFPGMIFTQISFCAGILTLSKNG